MSKFLPLWEEHRRAGPGEHVHFNEGQSSRSAQAQIKAQKRVFYNLAASKVHTHPWRNTHVSKRGIRVRTQGRGKGLVHWKSCYFYSTYCDLFLVFEMGKADFLTPKAIANRIKAKGLQKLRWYCQMCQKQCRDEVSLCERVSCSSVTLVLFIYLFS